MSNTQVSTEQPRAARIPAAATVDLKLEVIAIPVSDVDRAKAFYGGLGWTVDADFMVGKDFRAVQLTPPGSPCSIHLSTTAVPGSAQGMFLVVSDIEAARKELIAHGADVSEVFHFDGDHRPVPGPDPKLPSYGSYASFSDPDGNRWVLQQVTTRLPGRGLSNDVATLTELFQETEQRHGTVRADRSETPLVRLVRRLRGCARTRQDARRGGRGGDAPHRKCTRSTSVELVSRLLHSARRGIPQFGRAVRAVLRRPRGLPPHRGSPRTMTCGEARAFHPRSSGHRAHALRGYSRRSERCAASIDDGRTCRRPAGIMGAWRWLGCFSGMAHRKSHGKRRPQARRSAPRRRETAPRDPAAPGTRARVAPDPGQHPGDGGAPDGKRRGRSRQPPAHRVLRPDGRGNCANGE